MPEEMRSSRVCYGTMRRTAAQQVDNDIVMMDYEDAEEADDFEEGEDGELRLVEEKHKKKKGLMDQKNMQELFMFGKKHFLPNNLLIWDTVFCIIITTKSHVSPIFI